MVTVIIPVYNGEKTIGRALASLISNIDYIDEVIVVDDGSSDNTPVEAWRFRALLDKKLAIYTVDGSQNGPGYCRRFGLLKAKGEWVTFLDADDCLTPSSLKYVSKRLTDDIVLLHTNTIYYESGSFDPETIGAQDNSCGGNFYKREYLIENDLLPHETLRMAEDEYFNTKVDTFIRLVDPMGSLLIARYYYPVYEVHHDIEDGLSYALANWGEYLTKYHLLAAQYIAEDFIGFKQIRDEIEEFYIISFVSAFFLLQGLLQDNEVEFDRSEGFSYFKDAVQFFEDTFAKDRSALIEWYKKNPETVFDLCEGASLSVGFDITTFLDFEEFIENDC